MCTKEKLIEAYRRLSQEIDQEKKEKFYQIQEKGFDCVDDHIVKDSKICILLVPEKKKCSLKNRRQGKQERIFLIL